MSDSHKKDKEHDDQERNEELFERLFHHTNDRSLLAAVRNNPYPSWMFDLRTLQIIEVNEAALQQYGYTHEEFIALTALDLRPAEEVRHFLKFAVQHPTSKLTPVPMSHRNKHGEAFLVQVRSRTTRYRGDPVELVCAVPES